MEPEQENYSISLSEFKAKEYILSGPEEIEDIENEHYEIVKKSNTSCPKLPFGCRQEDWEKFKSMVRENDEVVHFSSPPEHWAALYGRAGYAIIRGDKVVDVFIILVN
ncbi:MAG: hypothetical protein KZQ93_06175 [Candidatus Thiodiazotropha sp. (ex Monitilora ramsayi)]|nr:hypothetical protein [Candidatus Thiodiazotropha sp. (ex Monitilora ramsayi)]